MDAKLSIVEEDVGMNNSIKEEVKKDEGGALKEMLEDEMDSLKEEEIWSRRRERINNALAAPRNAEQQYPAEVLAAARSLAGVILNAHVEEFISAIERLANQFDPSAIFNCLGASDNSLLHVAEVAGKDDILRLLLDYVPVHLLAAQNEWGDTPLHVAIGAKRSTAAAMLIRRTRDLPNVEDKNRFLRMKNKHGNTALHVAVFSRDIEIVRHRLNEDLEPVYWKNTCQLSPLNLAVDSGYPAIREVLFLRPLEPIEGTRLPAHSGCHHAWTLCPRKMAMDQFVKGSGIGLERNTCPTRTYEQGDKTHF